MSQNAFTKNILAAALISLGAVTGASAQGFGPYPKPKESPKATAGLTQEDVEFMRKAAFGGLLEVELGKLAQQKGTHEQVKQFGTRMAQDHGKSSAELKKLAATKGVALPTALDRKHARDLELLSKAVPGRFDHEYVEFMVKDRKEDIKVFEKEAKSGKDADVKSFASKTLPTLQEHLKLAQAAEAAVKSAKK